MKRLFLFSSLIYLKIDAMKKVILCLMYVLVIGAWACSAPKNTKVADSPTIRFASYNVALYRKDLGGLERDLKTGDDKQIKNVAAVIQEVRPDVLALMEFDYDPEARLLKAFQDNYLSVVQQGREAIEYRYRYSIPSNTGIPSGFDYNNDGKVAIPEDAFGYGRYEGQYASAILSKYPINKMIIRSFQKFPWSAMPDAKQPMNKDGSPYYDNEEWTTFRLSSKNHIDLPLTLPNGEIVHVILSHPTPPVFDGPEDRNGLRNYDEIRLLKDYISGEAYLLADNGIKGGLAEDDHFVIMGDLNADPVDGDSYLGAINQLLEHPKVQREITMGAKIPTSKGGHLHNQSKNDIGDPAHDTSFFGKRIDYVIPSKGVKVINSGVFWPAPGEALYEQVKDKAASDHLLVWADLIF
jgi:3-phytase